MTEALRTTPVDFDPFTEENAALPLTGPQREVWAAVQMGDDAACAYNQCFALTLRGALSAESMERALQHVVARHEALRVTIEAEGQQQSIANVSHVPLPVIDLADRPAASRRSEIERILREETAQPLNLVDGPPLRARLIREAPDLNRLVLTLHHIVCDGWSSAVLFSDLGRMYAVDRYGLVPQLPAVASYRDYVMRETGRTHDTAARVDEDYWAQQYADDIPILDLPSDQPRPGIKTYNGARHELRIDEALYRALKLTGAANGCTLFVTLLAAFEALIARLSGQEDFVIGIPMAGHALLDNAHLVGHCVSMVPLRCRVDHGARFAEALKCARTALLEAQAHQRVTFGSLLRRLNVPRDPGRTPLVSVTFNIDRIGAPFDFGSDLQLIAVEGARKRFVNFELSINAVDSGRDLVFECEYNTDLYTAATIERWLGHYKVLLEGIASDPGRCIDELPLLTEAERRRLLFEWNDTAVRAPTDVLLHELFEAQADRTPDAVAVIAEDRRLTYRELDARANQLAQWLQKAGIEPDALVPICVERSLEMMVGLLGILKAGAAYVPLDPELPAPRIGYMLEEVRAPIALTQHDLVARLPTGQARLVCLDTDWPAIAKAPDARPRLGATAESLAYVIYTSGSSGRPKGVMVTHAAICNHMRWMHRVYPLTPNDAVLQKTGFGFDASVWEFFAPLMAGARVVMARPAGHLDPAYVAEAILSHGATRLQLVPSQLRLLLEEPAFWCCAPPLKHVFCGGETLTRELCAEFYRRMPHAALHNLYGPTEATIDATAWDVPRNDIPDVIPIGRPIDNTRTYVVNSRMQLAPAGVPGELLIGGAGVARGYLARSELTAERFLPDPFCPGERERVYRTGDLARYLPDGNLQYLGRIDAQLKIRGYRIEAGEIEAAILPHPAIRQAAVVAWKDASGEKRLVAYLVAENQTTDLVDQLRSRIRATLPEYMVPAYFVPLDALPLNHNGKLDRRALPPPGSLQPGSVQRIPRQPPVAPRTAPEALVARIFSEALQRNDIGIHENFFDLGGDSIIAARLMARLRAASGVDLPLRNLFERPTVAGLAEAMDALSWLAKSAAPWDGGERERIEL